MKLMNEIYYIYFGLKSLDQVDHILSGFGFVENELFEYDLAGLRWRVNLDLDKEEIFDKGEMDEKYDFDSYFLKNLFINAEINKIVALEFMDLNIGMGEILKYRKKIENQMIEMAKRVNVPFAIRYRVNEEFVYPVYLSIEN